MGATQHSKTTRSGQSGAGMSRSGVKKTSGNNHEGRQQLKKMGDAQTARDEALKRGSGRRNK